MLATAQNRRTASSLIAWNRFSSISATKEPAISKPVTTAIFKVPFP